MARREPDLPGLIVPRARFLPRGRDGRFVKVALSHERRRIIIRAVELRERLNLPRAAVFEALLHRGEAGSGDAA